MITPRMRYCENDVDTEPAGFFTVSIDIDTETLDVIE